MTAAIERQTGLVCALWAKRSHVSCCRSSKTPAIAKAVSSVSAGTRILWLIASSDI